MLFGTDGVRGYAGKELNAYLAMEVAMAVGIHFKQKAVTKTILVGKDTRKSGYMIENAIVSGLTAVGYNVLQIGPMPTPAIAFLTEDLRCDCGIMISASHNPYYDNGIKIFDSQGFKLDKEDEKAIEKIYNDKKLLKNSLVTELDIGYAKRIDDVIGRYIVHIKNSFDKDLNLKSLRVVLDCANGAAYKVAPAVFSELGADVFVLNDKPNGSNINELCGALYPNELCDEVKRLRADVGFAFDGDADRLVVVDERGQVVNGDCVIAALGLALQKENKLKGGVVATKMSNMAFFECLEENNIKYEKSDVGDKNVFESMKSMGSNFGGEQSGHIIFSDYAKTGDGVVSALQFAKLLIKSNKKASKLSPFKPYPQILTNLKITEKKPLESIKGLDKIQKELDSHKIGYLFRYSGTENLLRILLEGKDEELLQSYTQKLKEFFKENL